MRDKGIFLLILLCMGVDCCFGQSTHKNRMVLIVDGAVQDTIDTDKAGGKDLIVSYPFADSTRPAGYLTEPVCPEGQLKWIIFSDVSVKVEHPVFVALGSLMHPGDSVHITLSANGRFYSGRGFEKFQLQFAIEQAKKKIENPVPEYGKKGGLKLISVEQYLQISHYYDEQLKAIGDCLLSSGLKVNRQDYAWVKCTAIQEVEYSRLSAFGHIPFDKRADFYHLREDLGRVWDTTMYNSQATWFRHQFNVPGLTPSYSYYFSRMEAWRKLLFDLRNDTLASKAMRVKMYFDQLNKNFRGLMLERGLCYFLDEQVIMEMGAYNPMAQGLLKSYYARSTYSVYKKWVQSLEADHQYLFERNAGVPMFQLKDGDGNTFTEKDIRGKLCILHFSKGKEVAPTLQQLMQRYKSDPNIILLNISVDSRWVKTKDRYTGNQGIRMVPVDKVQASEIVRNFNVAEFPCIRIVDQFGKFVINEKKPHASMPSAIELDSMISAQLQRMKDGPYIVYENGQQNTYYINGASVDRQTAAINIECATDQEKKQLNIQLHDQIIPPSCAYAEVERLLVLSDIEGNFGAFRKLLQSNKVIDDDFNWTFGNGHLVFAGDMFDRGEQVTECLWLIYSLEEQARDNGGFVHFILGNHEIMNLNGNDSYAREKYKVNYRLMGRTVSELFNENSELGRWLRSKNIIEKIGNKLFCHAGISPHVNSLPLTLEQINTLARQYYDKSGIAEKSADLNLNTLFDAHKSPFWYRQYYRDDYINKGSSQIIRHAAESQIDSTCRKFAVEHIITGHTIVADTISVHYNGKVINTDTRHAEGKSEALLIEGTSFYRVNDACTKVLLFRKSEDEITTGQITAGGHQ